MINLYKIVLWIIFLIIFIFTINLNPYKKKKEKTFHNNQHWRNIQIKATNIKKKSYYVLFIITSILLICVSLINFKINISLDLIFFIAFLCLTYGNIIEFFSLIYFNKRL